MSSEYPVFERATKALDAFQIEIPSWGFANTGTRFGKFVQAAAASTLSCGSCVKPTTTLAATGSSE